MDPNDRMEPTLGKAVSPSPRRRDKVEPDSTAPDLTTRAALIVIAIAAVFWVADKLYDRYLQYHAMQVIERELEKLEATFESMSEEQAARARAQRRQRANTTTGQWLAKNCSDWQSSYESRATQMARAEMQTQCRAYQRYLETGLVPPGVPR